MTSDTSFSQKTTADHIHFIKDQKLVITHILLKPVPSVFGLSCLVLKTPNKSFENIVDLFILIVPASVGGRGWYEEELNI